MTLEAGTKLGRYEVRSKIGEGGMGEVYLAQDTKLDRRVAIKFLNQEFSKDEDKLNRFVREARAASALNHPNILTVYEIGEVDGQNYITTELIDGTTLREPLRKEPLPLNTILKIGVQVAEALSAAHQAGIIHRDIKPENIMIRRDGYAKVLDFGLAKLSESRQVGIATGSEDATRVQVNTTPGVVMGTVSYMSPEQARGNVTDARTDIWSLGVVLYEMLAGKVPFTGETVNHTIVSILEREPLLLEKVPAELQRIVRKALTKDVDMRYQSARDLLIDLKNLRRDLDIQGELERSIIPNRAATTESPNENQTQVYASGSVAATSSSQAAATHSVTISASSLEYAITKAKSHKLATAIIGVLLVGVISTVGYFAFVSRGGSTKQINSIAVMPFVNESGNADFDYLTDGMTDTLISSLSHVPNLSVKAHTSVFRYKGKDTSPKTVANELNVQAVLNGRVMQRGDDLTVALELIDPTTENVIWSEKYDRKRGDLVSLQKEIATDVSNKLKSRLTGADEQRVAKTYTTNTEAYQLYLKGRFFWNQRNAASLKKAAEYFQQAIDKDPTYALAYSGLADSYALLPNYSGGRPEEYFPKAKAAALKAVQLDDNLAEGHTSLANILISFEWNVADSTREFKRAIDLNPNYATAHHWYSDGPLLSTRQFDESIAEMKRAQEIDPLSLIINGELGANYMYAGHYDAAIEQLRKTIQMDDTFYYAHWNLGIAYRMKGQYPQAIAEYQTAFRLSGDPSMLSYIGEAQAASGDRAAALKTLADLKDRAQKEYVPSSAIAQLYGAVGDRDEAFRQLEDAYRTHAIELQLIKVEPMLNSLRGDPRLDELTKRVFKE